MLPFLFLAVALLALYFVVRLAVLHALLEADETRRTRDSLGVASREPDTTS